jgi:prepilin-type N-terminal cleavage/methylation domain-containing protein
MLKKAFTLIELIFAIVIIGVLASVAIPKFSGLTGNSKVAAELSTAASIQTALEACHGEWIINEGSFTCGASIASSSLNSNGYPNPTDLGSSKENPFDNLLKSTSSNDWVRDDTDNTVFCGPASKVGSGVKQNTNKPNNPYKGRCWEYDSSDGTFELAPNP